MGQCYCSPFILPQAETTSVDDGLQNFFDLLAANASNEPKKTIVEGLVEQDDVSLRTIENLEDINKVLKEIINGHIWNKTQDKTGKVFSKYKYSSNSFVNALHLAFKEHLSVEISPDIIWLIIIQQISLHVNKNPDKFRDFCKS